MRSPNRSFTRLAAGLAVLIGALWLAPAAQAAKRVEAVLGGTGTTGGLFQNPADIVADHDTGRFYVADRGNNRIQRFSSAGEFELAIGSDVVKPGGLGEVAGNEQQQIVVKATGGAFPLRFPDFTATTEPIPFDASAETVQAALEALPALAPGDVIVTGPAGGPWTVEFDGAWGDADVPRINPATGTLTGGPSRATVTTLVPGSGLEVCTVASQCQAGGDNFVGGGFIQPAQLGLNQATDRLYVSDAANRITELAADGSFARLWGPGVVKAGGAGDVPTNERQRIGRHPNPAEAPDGGSFALRFTPPPFDATQTTGQIPLGATSEQVQTALETLTAFAPGDVVVTGPAGGPWTVEFAGAYADTDVSQLGFEGSNLTKAGLPAPGAQLLIETKVAAGGFEICTVAPQCEAGSLGGQAAGQLAGGAVPPLAVGPTGRVFVGDTRNGRVAEYESDGDFVRAWGWGVATEAKAFEICTIATGCHRGLPFFSQGASVNTPSGHFASDQNIEATREFPTQVAVGPSGVVFANNADTDRFGGPPEGHRLERFDSTAAVAADLLLAPIRSETPSNDAPAGPLPPGEAGGLEPDPASGHLYYLRESKVYELVPAGSGSVAAVHLADSKVHLLGLGYDDATGHLIGSVLNLTIDNRVVIAGDAGMPPPIAALGELEETGETSAVFRGEVTPNGPTGIGTSYRFEYRKATDSNWQKLPSPDLKVGDGNAPVSVEQPVNGLEVAATYEVRLVATKEFDGGQAVTEVKSFILGEVPPTVTTVYPQARTETTARLTGVINPRNLDTTYYFEWGTDATYGQQAPAVPAVLAGIDQPVTVTAEIDGLSPGTEYHYRLVADNGVEQAPGDTAVEGGDVAFVTRAAVVPRPQRGYELVSPPFKAVRSITDPGGEEGENPNVGVPSLDGESFVWRIPIFSLTDEVLYSGVGDHRLFERTAQGWSGRTLNTLPLMEGYSPDLLRQNAGASSGDLQTQSIGFWGGQQNPPSGALLPTEGTTANRLYTRRLGTGVEGYTPWLTNPDLQWPGLPEDPFDYVLASEADRALINDDGTAMLRGGPYYDLVDDPATPADEDPTSPATGSIYLQRTADPDDVPGAAKEVVNVCTGSGEDATELPARVGSGTATDTIGAQGCMAGTALGAALGAAGFGLEGARFGPLTTAMSGDGSISFFSSPDPSSSSTPAGCEAGTGIATSCPPQLLVRFAPPGEAPRVAWIGRSRSAPGPDNSYSGAPIAGQQIGLMGPTVFQGASRDGRVVYFKTNAPLTPDDPNGSGTPGPKTTGSASHLSWDLYRYELPEGTEIDPAEGTLTRVSGGPAGTADQGTNLDGTTPGTAPGGSGSPLRYLSDDGDKAYFVTTSPIVGADTSPPIAGATTPSGSPGNAQVRNLYLFDAAATGADRYRFVAKLPFSSDRFDVDGCASYASEIGYHLFPKQTGVGHDDTNCFRGTRDGSHVAFSTAGRLTGDDTDTAVDLYLYDAEADELTRVTAPPSGANPYPCGNEGGGGFCNGDLGFAPSTFLDSTPVGGPGPQARGFGAARYGNLAENGDEVALFFESRLPLVEEDQNGNHWDVYEWREGELSLVSRGTPGRHSYYSGNSLDGRDVFLFTSDRIDSRETDDFDYDIYDYRVEGGFPPELPKDSCDPIALECESAAKPAPPVRVAGTVDAASNGNVVPPTRCGKGKVRRGKRCVRRTATLPGRCRKLSGKDKRRCTARARSRRAR